MGFGQELVAAQETDLTVRQQTKLKSKKRTLTESRLHNPK